MQQFHQFVLPSYFVSHPVKNKSGEFSEADQYLWKDTSAASLQAREQKTTCRQPGQGNTLDTADRQVRQ